MANLSDSSQLGAKVAELRVDSGQDVLVEHGLRFHGDCIDFDAWELDDLLHRNFLILQASCFKVEHQEMVVDLSELCDSLRKTPVPLPVTFVAGPLVLCISQAPIIKIGFIKVRFILKF
jgi:hypothetical protein